MFAVMVAAPPAPAASLVPVDPMYVLLFGGNASAERGDRGARDEAASATGNRWQIVTHSIRRFVDDEGRSYAGTDDLAFRPRLVSALGPMATLQRATIAADRGPWSQDVYAQRTLIGNADTGVHLLGGIKVGVLGGEGPARGGEASLANTAQLSPASTGTLVGPMLGIAGDGQLHQHRVRGVFQQSKLYGNAELTRSVAGAEGVDGLRSGVESYVERRDLNVSVSELGLNYQYDFNDRVAFGMGAMASVWWNLPDSAMGTGGAGDPEVYLGGMGTLEMKF